MSPCFTKLYVCLFIVFRSVGWASQHRTTPAWRWARGPYRSPNDPGACRRNPQTWRKIMAMGYILCTMWLFNIARENHHF